VDTCKTTVYNPLIEADTEESVDFLELEAKVYEYIFLIDRSGSMSGTSIVLAVQALKLFIHSLP